MELPVELCNLLAQWCNQFASDDFTEDASSKGVVAYRVSPNDTVKHIDLLEARLRKVVADLLAL